MAKSQFMFGAVLDSDKEHHVARWTLHGQAAQVRDAVGKVWCEEDPTEGWKAARIEGMRVVRVELRIVPPTVRRLNQSSISQGPKP